MSGVKRIDGREANNFDWTNFGKHIWTNFDRDHRAGLQGIGNWVEWKTLPSCPPDVDRGPVRPIPDPVGLLKLVLLIIKYFCQSLSSTFAEVIPVEVIPPSERRERMMSMTMMSKSLASNFHNVCDPQKSSNFVDRERANVIGNVPYVIWSQSY